MPTLPELRAPEPDASCERCPAPIFFADAEGRITHANPAFCRLVREDPEVVVGRGLGSTRLGNVHETIELDARNTFASGGTTQRVVTYERQGRPTSLLLWLVGQPEEEGRERRLWGMVVPLDRDLL